LGVDESKREVPTADAARFAEEEGLLFVEASAKSGDGVEDAFVRAACEILDKGASCRLEWSPGVKLSTPGAAPAAEHSDAIIFILPPSSCHPES
jgi:Ras-related protein Rab-2A